MRLNRKFFENLLNTFPDGVFFTDLNKKILYWSEGAERLSGRPAKEMVGKSCDDRQLWLCDDRSGDPCQARCPFSLPAGSPPPEADLFLTHKDGRWVPVRVRAVPVQDAKGRPIGVAEFFQDNIQKLLHLKELDQLREAALLDSLTGLGNRQFILKHLIANLERMKRYWWPFGILFIGIDDFARLNALGPGVGDHVIRMVARVINDNTRIFDSIGRWGEDKFVALIENVAEQQLTAIANKFLFLAEHSSLPTPGGGIPISVSILARIPGPEDTVDTLIDSSWSGLKDLQGTASNALSVVKS
ncbi:MAG: sensor domain-containing diguanylate cyclase [bacterium]|nr:sensor domain-containing diguanylate cyclase [bacterium]